MCRECSNNLKYQSMLGRGCHLFPQSSRTVSSLPHLSSAQPVELVFWLLDISEMGERRGAESRLIKEVCTTVIYKKGIVIIPPAFFALKCVFFFLKVTLSLSWLSIPKAPSQQPGSSEAAQLLLGNHSVCGRGSRFSHKKCRIPAETRSI